MRNAGITALIITGSLFTASPVQAQSAPQPRGFVRAIGGVTFVTEAGAQASGGLGINLTPHVALIGEVGRLTNVLPKSLQADLDSAAPLLGAQFGRPLTIDGRARAFYGIAGVRLTGRDTGRVTPHLEVMAGRARGTSVITASVPSGDVSAGVEKALGMPRSETHAMYTAGAGISLAAGHRVIFEIGYRYARIQLGADDPRINTSAFHGGVRFGF